MKTRTIFAILLLQFSFAANIVYGQQVNVKPIVWKWNHGLTVPGTVYQEIGTKELAERMKVATNGRLLIEVIEGEPPGEILRSVRDGRFNGGTLCTAYVTESALYEYNGLPFLIENIDELQKIWHATKDILVKDMLERYNTRMFTKGVWPVVMAAANKEIRKVEDHRGLKLRTYGVESTLMLKAFDAAPIAMPFGEVYVALQRGMMDGILTGVSSGLGLKVWEVTKYINKWDYAYAGYSFIVGDDSWDKIPENLKPIVQGVFSDLEKDAFDRTKKEEINAFQEYVRKGMTIVKPEPGERQKAISICQPIWEDWIKRGGPKGGSVLQIAKRILGLE
jgi:TRAP-type C4-dicarboxylate transport system substrate-binding protein